MTITLTLAITTTITITQRKRQNYTQALTLTLTVIFFALVLNPTIKSHTHTVTQVDIPGRTFPVTRFYPSPCTIHGHDPHHDRQHHDHHRPTLTLSLTLHPKPSVERKL